MFSRVLVTVALCLAACGGPQIQERKAADVGKLGPATLEAHQPKEGDARTAKVRVYADAAVRARPGWREEITDQVDYASQLLTPLLGVKLEIESWKDWDRTGATSDALKALTEADKGDGVMWVVGYVAPNDVASKAMSELGDAQLLGRHIVVHAWPDDVEGEALKPSLPELQPSERTEVLAAHERHKQTVVLLHMIARTLGAIDETDPAWIQNATYSAKQTGFSDRNRELMQMGIDARLREDDDKAIAHDLLEKIEKEQWGGWVAPNRDEVIVQLRGIVTAARAGESGAEVPIAAAEQYDRIKMMGRKGDFDNALVELDNVLTAYPGNASLLLLKCELLLAKSMSPGKPAPGAKGPPPKAKPSAPDKAALAACGRVADVAPADPRPHFTIAEALLRTENIAGARAELEQAASKIAKLTTGQAAAWQRLIATYNALGALTWTEEAIEAAKLGDDPNAKVIAAQVASTRARYGVPRGTKLVKPAQEAELVAAVKNALSLVYANKHAEAAKAIAAGEKKWPNAPGLAAVRCDNELRQTHIDTARAACDRAIAADPNESWALYLSAVIAFKNTSASATKDGIEKLKKAIAVDPELGQAWRTLGKAYQRAKDKAAFEQLSKDYAAKFNTPLPP
ncbi:MAG: hypothetical protein HOV81_29660 [Kofleriaceae bacterium]|nr:hypothetical protein [Kofleriaceae bacterium]